jgi:WASH complex subunit 7, N-terminal
MKDLWRIKDVAFSPLEVRTDVQEYILGMFDILKPDAQVPISKIMSTFCYLEIESTNLKNEIEQNYFDPLIFFGESGQLYEVERPQDEVAGDMEIEMSRMLPVFSNMLETVRKLTAITKNILLQMNGLFNAKY